jgi:membrane protease subunit HflC
MLKTTGIAFAVVLVLVWIAASQTLYSVDETNHAVVQQFGDIKRVSSGPGLHFKAPFVQQVTYLDKRIVTLDTLPQEYLTSDEKRIVVDQVTRWKIVDPRAFFLTARSLEGGRGRLEPLVLGELRAQIATRPYDIMISEKRDHIMNIVKERVQVLVEAAGLGVSILDVRTKRADLPSEVEAAVFERMESARKVEADRHRALGQLRSDQITSETDREVTIMLACADRVSKEVRGAGEAAAIAIFAQALQQDPDFFTFIRRLEAYSSSFKSEDRLVLSTGSNFFQLLSGEAISIPEVEATEGAVIPLTEDVIDTISGEELETLIQQCVPQILHGSS